MLLLLQGSFGQVVEAQDLVTKQIVAIKIVQKKQQYTEQAQTEINILQQLHLPQQHDATNHIGTCSYRLVGASLDLVSIHGLVSGAILGGENTQESRLVLSWLMCVRCDGG